jgi:3-phosphoshikimate 1-carboxyvinyltransferase
MQVKISPSNINGTIVAPASKSSMQRACAAALITKGEHVLINPGKSNDDVAAMDVIQKLGAIVEKKSDGTLHIKSEGVQPTSNELNVGESGLGVRMFTPIVGLSNQLININGRGSLLTRPMHFFDEILPTVAVLVKSNEGKLPMQIQGTLVPQNITIDGSLSSQFLTGMLMAYAASNATGKVITVNNLKSKPYIDLTLKVLHDFGYNVQHENHERFVFGETNLTKRNVQYQVEGDWSGAAFLLVAGAVAGEIVVHGLDPFSTQADKAILQALMDAGAIMSVEAKQITIKKSMQLQPFQFDATDCPDLFPPLVALAAYCKGQTVIQGVSRLAHKESNRGLTLQEEFAKMNVKIDLQDDLMIVHGGGEVKGAAVNSYHDHRIAMACAVAALQANGETTIEDAEAIDKSYPDFYKDVKGLCITLC